MNLRLAIRSLRRSPAFAASALLILGVGIGTSVAMFTVFRAVLLRRLPVLDQDRIIVLWTTREGGVEYGATKGILAQVAKETHILRDVAGIAHRGAVAYPLSDGTRTIVLDQAVVDGNFFDVLGVRPVLGRMLRRDDEPRGTFQSAAGKSLGHAIVVSYGTWIQQFGADSGIIGRQLRDPSSQSAYTIVGVAPPGLDYPAGVGFWTPADNDVNQWMIAVARLKPGGTIAAARSEFFAIVHRLSPQFDLSGAVARSLSDQMVGDVRPTLVILTAAATLLFVIACVDVANLVLLRAAGRSREIAIRRAIGARYGDIVQQLLAEGGVLGVGGGLLGFACAALLLRALLALAPTRLPRVDVIRASGGPVALAAGTTIIAILIFGLAPALLAARSDLASPLRSDTRSGPDSKGRRRLRELLVATQVALALVMVSGAALLSESLARLQHVNLGYRADHLAFFAIAVPQEMIDSEPKVLALGDEVLPRLRAIPGVTAVTPVILQPMHGLNFYQWPFALEGQAPSEADKNPPVPVEGGDPQYFRTLGIPIIRGRGFSEPDGPGAPLEVVVSEAAARRFWPGHEALGKRIRYTVVPDSGWRTVVGVAPDIHLRSLREPTPTVFLRWRQSRWQGQVAIRTAASFAAVLPAIRAAVRDADPRFTVWGEATMDDYLAGPLAEPRLDAFLLSAFGCIALALAAMGLYGVMASAVRQQTHDIGVRMALGAAPEQLRRAVLRVALGITFAGTAAGVLAALASSKLLAAILFEVSPTDPAMLAAACVIVCCVGLASAYLPARRATKIDPALSLRVE